MIPVTLWIRLGLVAACLALGYTGYAKVKQIGYMEAEAKYTQVIADYEKQVNSKITNIESLSNQLIVENRDRAETLSLELEQIRLGIRKKPLVIVKDGECNPSSTFTDTIQKVNSRVNESIKGKKP